MGLVRRVHLSIYTFDVSLCLKGHSLKNVMVCLGMSVLRYYRGHSDGTQPAYNAFQAKLLLSPGTLDSRALCLHKPWTVNGNLCSRNKVLGSGKESVAAVSETLAGSTCLCCPPPCSSHEAA